MQGRALLELLEFVSSCNNLQNLSIDTLDHANSKFPDVYDKLSFPNLRSLEVHGHALTPRISTWHTPCLSNLTLEKSWGSPLSPYPMIPTTTTLRTLKIRGGDSGFIMGTIPNSLRRQGSLVAIEISHSHSNTYTHTLKALSNSLELCPQLAHIRLMAYPNLFWTYESAVQELIDSRPRIRVSIAVYRWTPAGWGLDPYNALRDLYPNNVELVCGIRDDFPTPLSAEHDD
jgi:hypothetical protein